MRYAPVLTKPSCSTPTATSRKDRPRISSSSATAFWPRHKVQRLVLSRLRDKGDGDFERGDSNGRKVEITRGTRTHKNLCASCAFCGFFLFTCLNSRSEKPKNPTHTSLSGSSGSWPSTSACRTRLS